MCRVQWDCPIIVAIATVLGIVLGILEFYGIIEVSTIVLGIILAFATLAISVLAIVAGLGKFETTKCIYRYGNCIILGSIFSIILSIIALLVTLVARNIGSAILVGVIGASLIVTLIAFTLFLLCLVRSNGRCKIQCRD